MPQPESELRVVQHRDGTCQVVRGECVVAEGFATNAEAWRWIDRNGDEGRGDSERANRIRASAAFS